MKDYKELIKKYLKMDQAMLVSIDIDAVNQVMNVLEDARKCHARIYICGNGGSAATASHFVCDFNKGVSQGQDDKYQLICLSDNVPTMMAVANDFSYDEIFKVQLEGRIGRDDVFIGISGSGNSNNVVFAAEYAKECGAIVLGFVGYDGGRLKLICDYVLHVDIDNMQVVEDIHMIYDHLMMWCLVNGEM